MSTRERLSVVNPDSLARPVGYNNGIKGQGELLFVAGQIGWTRERKLVSEDLVAQFAQALENVLEVVWAAGGRAESIARLTLYVTSKAEYRRRGKALGAAYRKRMGKHFPAMTLVEVKSLFDDGAKIEIEATALL
jgi:enamine deaminase RidA (YjgF/YER057c/UK114 family)